MIKYAFFAALAALSTLTLATPIIARDGLPQVTVAYGDLDLATPHGVATLDRRISRAVATLCPDQPDIRQVRAQRQVKLCRSQTAALITPQRDRAIALARAPASQTALAR